MEAKEIVNEDLDKKELDDIDDDLDFMDEDEQKMMAQLKEARIAEMKENYAENQKNKTLGHGQYDEITEEQFLPTVTKTTYVVVSFYHQDFERCKIIDMHLQKIAPMHTETRFCKLDAEKAPFFVEKLAIKTLPTLILFEDGIAIDRIIGFEELGGEDDFPTMNLIRRLVKVGMLLPKNNQEKGRMKINKKNKDESDDDY